MGKVGGNIGCLSLFAQVGLGWCLLPLPLVLLLLGLG